MAVHDSNSSLPLTRRHFLQALGAVGGAGMMMSGLSALGIGIASAQDAPPALKGEGNGRSVVILGAGLAGLVAAYELGKKGYRCQVIEARQYAGGRVQTARAGFVLPQLGQADEVCDFDEGEYFNHGPWRIPYHHRSTLHYTREFGIPLEIFVNHNEAAFAYRDAAGPLSGKAVRQQEIIADMRGHTAEILAKHVDQDALDLPLTQEEREKFLEFLVGEGQLERSSLDYLGTGGRGYLREPSAGLTPGEASVPHGLSALLQSDLYGIVSSVSGFTQQKTMFQPIGGMDRIPRAFEKVLEEDITYSAQVTRLQQQDDRVLVDYRDRTTGESRQVEADYCLCTIPLSVLRGIESDFSPEFKGAMEAVSYTPTCKLALQMKSRFWEVEDHVYGGHSFTHSSETGNISYPSTGWQGRKGILQGAYNFGSNAAQFSALGKTQRIEKALSVGEKIHAGYRRDFETAFSTAWHLVPENLGGWASWSREAREKSYPLLNEPQGRVLLAGEHLSYMTGWMAGAIESSWLQIEKLHELAMEAA